MRGGRGSAEFIAFSKNRMQELVQKLAALEIEMCMYQQAA